MKTLKTVKIDPDIYSDVYDIVGSFKRLNTPYTIKGVIEKAIVNYLPQLQKELEALKGRDV